MNSPRAGTDATTGGDAGPAAHTAVGGAADVAGDVARRFVEALGALEHHGDAEPLGGLYAEGGRAGNLQRPDAFEGRDGVRRFWRTYRSTFGEVASEFRTVVASGDGAALEWTTTGTVNGSPVRYDGVTVLELSDGAIVRSCAYYDPGWLGREALRATTGAAGTAEADTSAPEAGGPTGDERPEAERPDGGGPGGVDARQPDEAGGWRKDPGETG